MQTFAESDSNPQWYDLQYIVTMTTTTATTTTTITTTTTTTATNTPAATIADIAKYR